MTELRRNIIDMHGMGFKAKDIARSLSCSIHTVYGTLHKHRTGGVVKPPVSKNLQSEIQRANRQIQFYEGRLAVLRRHHAELVSASRG